jgi:predicted transcriptional regulator
LGELERAVMDVLWAAGAPLSVRDVVERLSGRQLAYTTVMTILDRLARKGALCRTRAGKAWMYTAADSREGFITSLMLDALGLTSDRHAALAHFARTVDADGAEALRGALRSGPDAGTGR